MTSDIAIRLDNISKCYQIYDKPRDRLKQSLYPRVQKLFGISLKTYHREFWALKDISFKVKKGETVGIIGRNGAGKSTLLQIICGTLTPTSGDIQVNGRVAALLELGAGFNPEFTGRENVYMNAGILGLKQAEIDSKYIDIVAFADIGEFIDQPVKTYSSGMYVRLAFAVIAHVDADILIIDEALSVGDANFSQKCMRFLREFKKHGSLIFVSHDISAVINLCERAILLDHGNVEMIGQPKEVSEYYHASLYNQTNVENVNENLVEEKSEGKNLNTHLTEFDRSFGSGQSQIIDVQLYNPERLPLSWVLGGKEVSLEIRCLAKETVAQPIVGFHFKDRLGQIIFGENSYLTFKDKALCIGSDIEFVVQFDFTLPVLPSGNYSFDIAVANGTHDNHVQHHWVHDALIVHVHSELAPQGIIGVPMHRISMSLATNLDT